MVEKNILEKLFQMWREMCILFPHALQLRETYQPDTIMWKGCFNAEGPYIPGVPDSFRQYIRTSFGKPFDFERFCGSQELMFYMRFQQVYMPHLTPLLPYVLFRWVCGGKRIYKLSQDLQNLLLNTSLGDMTWDDLKWPFDSFMLELPVPVGEHQYTHIVAVKIPEYDRQHLDVAFVICLANHQYCDYYDDVPEAILGAIRSGKMSASNTPRQVARALDQRTRRSDGTPDVNTGFCTIIPCAHGTSKMKDGILSSCPTSIAETIKESWRFDDIGRLVAGFMLYLQSLPPKSSEVSPWSSYRKDRDKRQNPTSFLADDARICQVESKYVFSAEERQMFADAHMNTLGSEVRCHFRSGYWRREPGHGHDPEAKKTIWVRWTIVRRDKLPEQGIPTGAKVTFPDGHSGS